jgi:hypothetical protein
MADNQLIGQEHGITVADEYTLVLTVVRPPNVKEVLFQISEVDESFDLYYKITGTNDEGKKEVTLVEDQLIEAGDSDYEVSSNPWMFYHVYLKNAIAESVAEADVDVSGV